MSINLTCSHPASQSSEQSRSLHVFFSLLLLYVLMICVCTKNGDIQHPDRLICVQKDGMKHSLSSVSLFMAAGFRFTAGYIYCWHEQCTCRHKQSHAIINNACVDSIYLCLHQQATAIFNNIAINHLSIRNA